MQDTDQRGSPGSPGGGGSARCLQLLPLLSVARHGDITCITYCEGVLYMGTSMGILAAFVVDTLSAPGAPAHGSSDPICRVQEHWVVPLCSSARRAAVETVQVASVQAQLGLALCNETLHVFRLGTLERVHRVRGACLSRVSVFASRASSRDPRRPKARTNLVICAVASRRRLHVCECALLSCGPGGENPAEAKGDRRRGAVTGRVWPGPFKLIQKLFVPARPSTIEWLSAQQLLVGFSREYTWLHLDKGKVVRVRSIAFGDPIIRRVPKRGILCTTGSEAVCLANPKKTDFSIHYSKAPSAVACSDRLVASLQPDKIVVHGLPGRPKAGSKAAPATPDPPERKGDHRTKSGGPGDVNLRPSARRCQWQYCKCHTHRAGSGGGGGGDAGRKRGALAACVRASSSSSSIRVVAKASEPCDWVEFSRQASAVIESAYNKNFKHCTLQSAGGNMDVSLENSTMTLAGVCFSVRRRAFSSYPQQEIKLKARAICRGRGESFFVTRKHQVYMLVRVPRSLLDDDRDFIERFHAPPRMSDVVFVKIDRSGDRFEAAGGGRGGAGPRSPQAAAGLGADDLATAADTGGSVGVGDTEGSSRDQRPSSTRARANGDTNWAQDALYDDNNEMNQLAELETHLNQVLSSAQHPLGRMIHLFSVHVLHTRKGDAKAAAQAEDRKVVKEMIERACGEVKEFMTRLVTTIQLLYRFPRNYQERVASLVETKLFNHIYPLFETLFHIYNHDSDKLFLQACKKLRFLSLSQFGSNLIESPSSAPRTPRTPGGAGEADAKADGGGVAASDAKTKADQDSSQDAKRGPPDIKDADENPSSSAARSMPTGRRRMSRTRVREREGAAADATSANSLGPPRPRSRSRSWGLGGGSGGVLDAPFAGEGEPIRILPKIGSRSSMTGKLQLLDDMHKQLVVCAERLWEEQHPDKPLVMCADDLMPILCYIIVRSKVSNLFSETHFLSEFLSQESLLGHSGFLVTTLQISLHYILQMYNRQTRRSQVLQEVNIRSRTLTSRSKGRRPSRARNSVSATSRSRSPGRRASLRADSTSSNVEENATLESAESAAESVSVLTVGSPTIDNAGISSKQFLSVEVSQELQEQAQQTVLETTASIRDMDKLVQMRRHISGMRRSVSGARLSDLAEERPERKRGASPNSRERSGSRHLRVAGGGLGRTRSRSVGSMLDSTSTAGFGLEGSEDGPDEYARLSPTGDRNSDDSPRNALPGRQKRAESDREGIDEFPRAATGLTVPSMLGLDPEIRIPILGTRAFVNASKIKILKNYFAKPA